MFFTKLHISDCTNMFVTYCKITCLFTSNTSSSRYLVGNKPNIATYTHKQFHKQNLLQQQQLRFCFNKSHFLLQHYNERKFFKILLVVLVRGKSISKIFISFYHNFQLKPVTSSSSSLRTHTHTYININDLHISSGAYLPDIKPSYTHARVEAADKSSSLGSSIYKFTFYYFSLNNSPGFLELSDFTKCNYDENYGGFSHNFNSWLISRTFTNPL